MRKVFYVLALATLLSSCEALSEVANIFNVDYALGDSESNISAVGDLTVSEMSYRTMESYAKGEEGSEAQLTTELTNSLANYAVELITGEEVNIPLTVIFNVAVRNDTEQSAGMSKVDVALGIDREGNGNVELLEDLQIAVNTSTIDNINANDWTTAVTEDENGITWEFQNTFTVEPGEVKALPIAVQFGNLGKPADLFSTNSPLVQLALQLAEGNTDRIHLRVRPYVNVSGVELPSLWINVTQGNWIGAGNLKP
ncbi:hypothetical protein [Algivirga pacifica]|uniref:Lipoprotein n=1 Tax=Algivirga pacifica TaxID=1162670 RepID=A0ABP9DF43_9BACT